MIVAGERKTGTYFWEEINFGKRGRASYRHSRNIKTRGEAVRYGKKRYGEGKFTQARLWHTKNILSDVEAGGIDTKGRYRREDYYRRKKDAVQSFRI